MAEELFLPTTIPGHPGPPPAPSAPGTHWAEIRRIAKNPAYQVRNRLDFGTIQQYAKCMVNGAKFPPVELADIKGTLFIVNGWHRLEAADLNKDQWIEATIKPMTHAEALRSAALGNSTHGVPLKSTEKQRAFKAFIRGKGHIKPDKSLMSYREISQALGGHNSHTTIRGWMFKNFPSIAKTMGGEDVGNPQGEPPRIDPQREIYRVTLKVVGEALALYDALTDPTDRYEVIEQMESALTKMKTKEHQPSEF